MLARALLATGAIVVGAAGIALSTLVPGYQRERRGAWAMHRASRLLLHALGIRLTKHAGPRSGPSLVVANRVSWLDVIVLAATGPVMPVVAIEVGTWPLVGALARRSGALFVGRDLLSGLPADVEQITMALRRGHRVLVFPSTANSGGRGGNAFRRAAFQAAVDAAVVVSPVALAYRRPCQCAVATVGLGETPSTSSARQLLRRRITAEVTWLPVIPAIIAPGHPSAGRARVAGAAERAIARTLHGPVQRASALDAAGSPGPASAPGFRAA